MSLPKPVLSYDDVVGVRNSIYHPARLIWYTWSKDPIKEAVIRAILSCQTKLGYADICGVMSVALGQREVCFRHSFSLAVE
jgi:hypothetical protein